MSDQRNDGSDEAREPTTSETAAVPEAAQIVPPSPPVVPETVVPAPPVVPPQPPVVPPHPSVTPGATVPGPPAAPEAIVPAPPVPTGAAASVPPVAPGPPPEPSAASISPQTKKHILSGLSTAAIAVGGAVAAGLVLALFVLLSAADALQSANLPFSADSVAGFGSLLLLAFTFAGLVLGGEVSLQVSAGLGGFGGGGAGGQLWLFPLTLTAAVFVLVLWWSIRQERTSPLRGIRNRLLFSGAVGLAASLVVLILAAIFAVRQGGEGVEVVISGTGYRVVLFGTVLVAGAVFLGRVIGARAPAGAHWVRAVANGVTALPRFVREALLYTTGLTIVFGLIALILGTVTLWDPLGFGALPLGLVALLNLTGAFVVLGHLGGVGISSGVGEYGSGETVTLFGQGGWSWLLFVVALLFSAVAAVWIGTRRGRNASLNLAEAWKLPVLILGAWILHGLFTFGLTVQAAGSIGIFGGGGSAGVALALWTPLVLFLWAVVVELGAQYLPASVYALSPRLHALLAGRRSVETWATGVVATPAAPVASAGPADSPDTASPQQSASPVAPPKPLSAGAKKGILWSAIGVGAVVVLGVAGAVAVSVVNSTRTPDAVALSYLGHIEDGDATAANAMVDPNVSNAARTHLTDEVLGSATERISEVSVRSSGSLSDDEAQLEVSYKLDGVTQNSYLTARKGEPEWLVLDTWEIVTPLAQSVRIDVEGAGSLAIGGEPVAFDDESSYRGGEVVLYPGIYEVATDDSALFELNSAQLQVTSESPQSAQFQFEPTQKLVDEVQAQVNALLDTCAASTEADPDDCPLRVYVYPSGTPVTWSIVAYPTVELSADGSSFEATEGEATASYTETFLGTPRDSTDEVSISFRGQVEISGDEVTVTEGY